MRCSPVQPTEQRQFTSRQANPARDGVVLAERTAPRPLPPGSRHSFGALSLGEPLPPIASASPGLSRTAPASPATSTRLPATSTRLPANRPKSAVARRPPSGAVTTVITVSPRNPPPHMVMGRSYTQFPDGTGTPQAWREVRAVHNFPRDAPAPIESQPKRSGNVGGGANTNIVGAASRVQVVREGRRGQDVGIAIPVWPKPGGRVSAIRPDPRGNAQPQRQHGAAAERPPLSPLASCCARIWHYDDGHRWYSFRGKGVGWLCVLLPALLVAGPVVQALKLMQLNGRCERCWARCWARDPLYDWFSWRDKGPGWRAMLAPLYALLVPARGRLRHLHRAVAGVLRFGDGGCGRGGGRRCWWRRRRRRGREHHAQRSTGCNQASRQTSSSARASLVTAGTRNAHDNSGVKSSHTSAEAHTEEKLQTIVKR
ncbi:uncharacterized protein LOC133347596 isoform X3 [Lethenteron reissneri]|uniref:uncharacterized protein LOC133347596 isoform X3 n=1 Tax=Lethenteron reissneri TaxID=7753 RepID=UPI002AB694C8|nr:uncharacterized protein LOC133347596 isoform X3 [Lethenteron reissneri]